MIVGGDIALQMGIQLEDIIRAISVALGTVFTPVHLIYILLGTLFGLLLGAIPGLGGVLAIVLLIPLTFDLSPSVALMVMSASVGGVHFGGSLTAILVNTPGTSGNLATLLDGHPLARQGRANEAIAASAVSSAGGAIIGLVLFVLATLAVLPLLLAFGPAEVMWISIFGIVVVALVTTGSTIPNLLAGGFTMLLAMHGLNRATGTARFTWESTYLIGGFHIVPVVVGLFAIAEMIRLVARGDTIAKTDSLSGSWLDGVRATIRHRRVFLRSAIVGWLVGVIPGVGGTIANFVAYGQARELSNDPGSFGKGNIVGVIAPEAANDTKDGGSLLPTLSFGIPGSASMAALLGAFVLHGVTPGPQLFQENLHIVFVIVLSLVIANLLSSLFGLLANKQLIRITQVSIVSIAPIIILVALMGTFAVRNNFGDVVAAFGFGIFGLLLLELKISRIVPVIAFILGPLIELQVHTGLSIANGEYIYFISSPISVVLVILILITLLWPMLRS